MQQLYQVPSEAEVVDSFRMSVSRRSGGKEEKSARAVTFRLKCSLRRSFCHTCRLQDSQMSLNGWCEVPEMGEMWSLQCESVLDNLQSRCSKLGGLISKGGSINE